MTEREAIKYFGISASDAFGELMNATEDNHIQAIKRYIDACDTALDAPEKSIKYRWHDLRKNPYDLPVTDGKYEVVVRDEYGEDWIAMATWSGKVLLTGNKKGFGLRAEFYNMSFSTNEIIAWREIEPFEEEE